MATSKTNLDITLYMIYNNIMSDGYLGFPNKFPVHRIYPTNQLERLKRERVESESESERLKKEEEKKSQRAAEAILARQIATSKSIARAEEHRKRDQASMERTSSLKSDVMEQIQSDAVNFTNKMRRQGKRPPYLANPSVGNGAWVLLSRLKTQPLYSGDSETAPLVRLFHEGIAIEDGVGLVFFESTASIQRLDLDDADFLAAIGGLPVNPVRPIRLVEPHDFRHQKMSVDDDLTYSRMLDELIHPVINPDVLVIEHQPPVQEFNRLLNLIA